MKNIDHIVPDVGGAGGAAEKDYYNDDYFKLTASILSLLRCALFNR